MSERLQRVVWSEGMLLSPQHFQQQDRYHEARLDARLSWLAPAAMGVATLMLDEVALTRDEVALRSFSGVLPSGETLRCGTSDSELPAARRLGASAPSGEAPLDVFVALASERTGASSYVDGAESPRRARYVVETRPVRDALSPSDEVSVSFARRNLVLLLGEEAREERDALKIAEIVRGADGGLQYAVDYVPPALRFGASPYLVACLRQLREACVARRKAVLDALHLRDDAQVEFAPDDVTRYLVLHSVSGVIPLLTQLLARADASPHALFLTLAQFAGQLAAFAAEDDAVTCPAYEPGDLRATFDGLFGTLRTLLDVAVARRVITVPLDARVDGMHLARIPDAHTLAPGGRFFLAVQSDLTDAGVYELVPRVGKVASWAEIPRYLEAAASAVPVDACLRPPREVPLRAGKYHFLLDVESTAWQAVVRECALAVHLPPPFDPRTTRVELIVIPER